MPPLAAIRSPTLAELADQLRFTPRATLLRQIERAEGLGETVDRGGTYPEDWVVARITGYRPEIESPAMLTGAILLADLSAFVERLCESAALARGDVPAGSLNADELARSLGVSRKTVDRLRRAGLIARRVRTPDGRRELVFSPRAVRAATKLHALRLENASSFSRMDAATREAVLSRAREIASEGGGTPAGIARRLAPEFGRSHETIRRLLITEGERARTRGEPPIVEHTAVISAREGELVLRALARGIEPASIASGLGRMRASVTRGANLARLRRLEALDLPRFDMNDRALESSHADPALFDDEMELGHVLALDASAPPADQERARAAAVRALLARAVASIAEARGLNPLAERLDRAETDLRWSARLIAQLVHGRLGVMVATVRSAVDRPLERVPPGELVAWWPELIASMSRAVLEYDPSHSGRLAGPVTLQVTRAATRLSKRLGPERAGRAGSLIAHERQVPSWAHRCTPWQALVEPDPRVFRVLDRLTPELRDLLCARYGWGRRPLTTRELGGELGTPPVKAAHAARRALRAALVEARRTMDP